MLVCAKCACEIKLQEYSTAEEQLTAIKAEIDTLLQSPWHPNTTSMDLIGELFSENYM